MSIELKPDTDVDVILFIAGTSSDGAEGDWLAAVLRQRGESWKLIYRFRYYVDDKSFDSKDEKHWYTVRAPDDDESPEGLRLAAMQVAALVASGLNAKVSILEVKGNGDDAQRILAMQPWCTVRFESEEGTTDPSTEVAARAFSLRDPNGDPS